MRKWPGSIARNQQASVGPLKIDPITRFRLYWKISTENQHEGEPCWEWTGGKNQFGYGLFWTGYNKISAHRWAYEHFREKIPKGLQTDHLCRNHGCVNPNHLEVVTQQENILRGEGQAAIHARKTHCIKGHPFDEKNTYISPSGGRMCRQCVNRRSREMYWKKKKALSS
jgi:hypothetical protein